MVPDSLLCSCARRLLWYCEGIPENREIDVLTPHDIISPGSVMNNQRAR